MDAVHVRRHVQPGCTACEFPGSRDTAVWTRDNALTAAIAFTVCSAVSLKQ